MENFMDGSCKLYCKMEALAKNKRRFHPFTVEAGISSQKEQSSDLKGSSSKHAAEITAVDCFGGKVRKGMMLNAGEVQLLNRRLKALEEEAEVMKEDFIENMEERKKLMNEIYQQFQEVRHHLQSRKQAAAEKQRDGVMMIDFHKNERTGTGLSQVLYQDSNPSIVNRRATMVPLEEPAEVMYEFSNRQLLPF